MAYKKFFQTLDEERMAILQQHVKKRGVLSVQELLRAVVIPDWLFEKPPPKQKKGTKRKSK